MANSVDFLIRGPWMFTGSCWKPCKTNKAVHFSAILIHAITCLSGRRFKTLYLLSIQLAINSIKCSRTFINIFKRVFVERQALFVEHTHTHTRARALAHNDKMRLHFAIDCEGDGCQNKENACSPFSFLSPRINHALSCSLITDINSLPLKEADPCGREVYSVGLRPLSFLGLRFRVPRGHWYLLCVVR